MQAENLQLLVASHKPNHYTSAHVVRLSRCHRHPCHYRQLRSIAYMCLLAGLFAVQERAKTGQRFLAASAERSSCFQKVIQDAFVCFKITVHSKSELLTEVDIFWTRCRTINTSILVTGHYLQLLSSLFRKVSYSSLNVHPVHRQWSKLNAFATFPQRSKRATHAKIPIGMFCGGD